VAENFRFQEALRYARREADKLGQLLTLRAMHSYDFSKTPFGNTEWRLNPEHSGGILLDGGVHLLAATRLLLGGDKIDTIGALATGLGEAKDAGDRVSATFKTAGGAVGVVFISYLGPDTLFEYTIACEKGTVILRNGVVTVQSEAREEKTDFGFGPVEAGVKPELDAFVDSILKGRPDARQTPEQAVDDVYLVCCPCAALMLVLLTTLID
jgi:predicted dehydrogenase